MGECQATVSRPSADVNEQPAQDKREEDTGKPGWLLLVFSLSAKRKSERVEIWRKLKRTGALPLGPPGYLLPNTAPNQEQFEWLAATIRGYKGQASVLRVQAIDDLPFNKLVQRFDEARSRDYEALLKDLSRMQKQKTLTGIRLSSIRRRFDEITAIDFFHCALRKRAEELIVQAVLGKKAPTPAARMRSARKAEFQNRTWVTRHRPGIDRASSAWLIKRFIDHAAKFAFADSAAELPNAIPFDMFEGAGFSHVGDHCTFETLCNDFKIRDPKVQVIAEMIHDADLRDNKFGRPEGIAIDTILTGWASEGIDDEVLLARGVQIFEGLFRSLK
jgi:hypothetical protein